MKTCRKLGAGGKAGVRVAARATRRRRRRRALGTQRRKVLRIPEAVTWCVAADEVLAMVGSAGDGDDGGGDKEHPWTERFGRRALNRRASMLWRRFDTTGPETNGRPASQRRDPWIIAGDRGWDRPSETEEEAHLYAAGWHSPTVPVTRDRRTLGSLRRSRGRRTSPPSGGWKRRWRAGREGHPAAAPADGGDLAFHRVLVDNLASCRQRQEASLLARSRSPDRRTRGLAHEPVPISP